nr:lysylphosphatidylglycerol synthase transmembrane domain-containing protein [Thiocapsa rosea]
MDPRSKGLQATGGGGALRFGRARDWAIGGALLAALVIAVKWTVGWGLVLSPWRTLSPLLVLALFGLTALSYVLRAVRVYDYFGSRFRGCFPIVLRLSMLHNTANNLLPMRAGEMVFPWLMRRYFGHGFLDAAAALLWIRILDLHFLALIGILILYLRDPSPIWWWAALLWLGGLLLFLPLRGLVSEWSGQSESGLAAKLIRLVRRVLSAAPAQPGIIARVYLWTALTWTLKFTAFAVLLEHFLPVEFWRLLTGVMGAELSTVLPFHGIAGSGSYELAVVAALAPLGVDPKLALAGAVNLHLFLLGSTLVLGALALLLPKTSVGAAGKPLCGS